MTGTELPAALRRCLSSMPEPSPRLMSRRTQTRLFEIAVVCESLRRRKQQTGVAELPQQSSYTPQHCGVVIDDKDDISIWHGIISRRLARHAASKDLLWIAKIANQLSLARPVVSASKRSLVCLA